MMALTIPMSIAIMIPVSIAVSAPATATTADDGPIAAAAGAARNPLGHVEDEEAEGSSERGAETA
jgi:hypothetical protein